MIAALWGLLIWHEFHQANVRARLSLIGMFCSYTIALVLISEAYRFA